VSVWLLLASQRFARLRLAAAAGLACGLGLLVKETFVYFVAGVVLVLVIRGGWRHWQGVAVFLAVAALVGLPWYVAHFGELTEHAGNIHAGAGTATSAEPGSIFPPRWSRKNAGWYFWSGLNVQLLAPLVAFAAVGTVWAVARFIRLRSPSSFAPELVIGGLVSWAGVTMTMPHDARYSLPSLVYLAVLGTGWITSLPKVLRGAAIVVLLAVAVINNLGASLATGHRLAVTLPGAPLTSPLMERQITFYAPMGSRPRRDGDVLGLMRALRRNGVRAVHWDLAAEAIGFNFTHQGIGAYSAMAGLRPSVTTDYAGLGPRDAYMLRWPLAGAEAPPCIQLDEATGIWVRLGNPLRPGAPFFCPLRAPPFYSG
jgi:4-amino-4-deoxy-L-arabinose transferase-like glycosyltransferase